MTEKTVYLDYVRSVAACVERVTHKYGYTLEEALGYCQVDMELQLRDNPEQRILALIAVCAFAIERDSVEDVDDEGMRRDVKTGLETFDSENYRRTASVEDWEALTRDIGRVRAKLLGEPGEC